MLKSGILCSEIFFALNSVLGSMVNRFIRGKLFYDFVFCVSESLYNFKRRARGLQLHATKQRFIVFTTRPSLLYENKICAHTDRK